MTPSTAAVDSPYPRTYRLSLPWRRPPLTENQRLNWQAKSRITKEVRHTVGWLVKTAGIPSCAQCEVTLYWAPNVRRKRDDDNPFPTYKAACDGIVDAGVVSDDESCYMMKHTPVILPVRKTAAMWIEIVITRVGDEDGA
jgi:crossover junction endodeoxyribonuclease RusA